MSAAPNKAVQVVIVCGTLGAWLLISNHCAVGAAVAATAQPTMTQVHCHDTQPAPTKHKGQESMPCCKLLKALKANTLTFAMNTFEFVLKEYFVGTTLTMISESHRLLIACDSGPPACVSSFSESVLQRSILAHAPPSSLS